MSAPGIYEKVLSLLELWDIKATKANGGMFEAERDMYNLALDIIVSAAFDFPTSRCTIARQVERFKSAAGPTVTVSNQATDPVSFENIPLDPELQACVYLTESIGVSFQSIFPRLAHWLYLQKAASKKAIRLKDHLIRSSIDRGIARVKEGGSPSKSDTRCAVDMLLSRERTIAISNNTIPNPHSRAIYDELFGYIIGGHDTTSVTLSWWVKYMARYPASQTSLRDHLHRAFPLAASAKRFPSSTEIIHAHIPELDAMIEETHRCAHIVPTVIRQSIVDTQILGYRIPKGTHIWFYTSGASFKKPAYSIPLEKRTESGRKVTERVGTWDPETVSEFLPERWLRKETDEDGVEREAFDPQAGPQMAFGAGARGCFGRRLAYLEMRITIVLLLWKFEFMEVEGKLGEFEGVDFFAVTPKHCYVRLKSIT